MVDTGTNFGVLTGVFTPLDARRFQVLSGGRYFTVCTDEDFSRAEDGDNCFIQFRLDMVDGKVIIKGYSLHFGYKPEARKPYKEDA